MWMKEIDDIVFIFNRLGTWLLLRLRKQIQISKDVIEAIEGCVGVAARALLRLYHGNRRPLNYGDQV